MHGCAQVQEAADKAQSELASLAGSVSSAEQAAEEAQAAERSARAELQAALTGKDEQLEKARAAAAEVRAAHTRRQLLPYCLTDTSHHNHSAATKYVTAGGA